MAKDIKGKVGRAFCTECHAKIDQGKSEDGNGWVEGYLAVFNNVDLGGDRILPGAFSRSISNYLASKKVPFMAVHFAYGGDVYDMVGVITKAKEDSYGLWIHADFLGDADSQKVRGKIREAIEKDVFFGLSVGFRVIAYGIVEEDGKTIYELKELQLAEGTATLKPMNTLAVIHSAKNEQAREQLEALVCSSLGVEPATVAKAFDQMLEDLASPSEDPSSTLGTNDPDLDILSLKTFLEGVGV